MKNKYYILLLVILTISGGAVFYSRAGFGSLKIENFNIVSQPVSIDPDYTDITIPPNIAPLNFSIKETGKKFFVRIYAEKGNEIKIVSKKGSIIIPLKKWRRLLDINRGGQLFFDVYIKDEQGGWNKYQTIANQIAEEQIDPYIAYRLIKPIFNCWHSVGLYQRNLTNYDESVIVHGESFNRGCVNCHTFLNNSPDKMLFGIRSTKYGAKTILKANKKVNKIGTKFTYSAWHPSGRLVVYSTNKIMQFFHASGMEVRDVIDLDSALLYYMIDDNVVGTNHAISDKDYLETYPTWSPDGRYLYFCSAPITWTGLSEILPEGYEKIRYSLMRISYDIDKDQWGHLETVLSADKMQRNILLPRLSPDGRYLLFCMCDYGSFPIYQQNSDLYMMDLQTGEYNKPDINSDYAESWHSWSSNSRWISFSSKRRGGLFTRTYISYVDKSGKACKPFIMPQKDPDFYDSFVKTYSVPEFITGPIDASEREFARAVRSSNEIEVVLPITGATVKASGDTQEYNRE